MFLSTEKHSNASSSMSSVCVSSAAMKLSPCKVNSTSRAAWQNVCAATLFIVDLIFTMDCITFSWNCIATGRAPHNALFFFTATRLHARSPTSWISHRDVFIQQCVVKRQTCRGGHTICFSNFCTGWMRSSNNSLTQHNAGVPAKQSVRVSHAKCIVTSLDRKKSIPSRFQLWSSNH